MVSRTAVVWDDELREARSALESMLIPDETILALAVQRRLFALSHRRVLVAATTGRLIGFSRALIGGFTPVDLRWQDIKGVHVQAGVFGSDLTVTGLSRSDLAGGGAELVLKFGGLRGPEAQAVYRICQAQEQAWREKRRLRELDELRAQSGGLQTAYVASVNRFCNDGDPVERLKRARHLLDDGFISDSEYETIKARIVGQI
ncbi:PH domain-containing protein [Paraburkholderia caballeronis]|uniref:PH domain-containing protein n=1 Tax=Paraburkholderia caballeronis TaxID=416943 RepID=UPI0010665221|nr:PH domain-containing protein [Paraburkholderia caballeronis]TDV16309.1 PH (Pleckstrin Homology) domain-containing protein [Paraburkholderia caballeronis]TDV20659.1 PH (Pleckstrin Homology) domain-containing protein [Paraburkholderia caballeronis]TDV33127.1 PH (Pleckstrin Homology) domain-containing protein [Paraburkholderia caballeronis]